MDEDEKGEDMPAGCATPTAEQGRAMLEKTGNLVKLPILQRILNNFSGLMDIDAAIGIAIGCDSLHEASHPKPDLKPTVSFTS